MLERPLAPSAGAQRLRSLLPELEPAAARESVDEFQLYDAVRSDLHAHALAEPLALFLDDLHVVDDSSLVLAEFVARALSRRRVALFGSQRSSVAEQPELEPPELERSMSRLARVAEQVALGPLGCADVRAWMQKAGAGGDLDAARRVHEAI